MDNENELGLDLDNLEVQAEEKLKIKNRYEKLSEKVIQEKAEKEKLFKAKEESDKQNIELVRERDFFKDFSAQSSKYPQASEYQDKIWEKVKGGYTTEDAMVAVLAKEGKFGVSNEPITSVPSPEGGSAPTQTVDLDKNLGDMSREEKLNALIEADKRGEIEMALRGRA